MNKQKSDEMNIWLNKALYLKISVAEQILNVIEGGKEVKSYQISTGLNGCSEQSGSGGTPRGKHYVRAMIGAGADKNAVFVGRRETGEIYTSTLAEQFPKRDWVLGRIMWLSGLEQGKNRLGNVDTMRRYIYIHGTPEVELLGKAVSHGCIRMSPDDVVELFSMLQVGVRVDICEN